MTTSKARALASRRNGAKSRGPRTAAGRARAARNALKHGLCARSLVLLEDEDRRAFGAFEKAVHAELAPAGALEADLVARIVVAAWRARRADRLEAALLGKFVRMARTDPGPYASLGLEVVRDCNGPRALETLVRYRGSVFAELFRSLAALNAVQGQDRSLPRLAAPLPDGARTKRTPEEEADQGVGV